MAKRPFTTKDLTQLADRLRAQAASLDAISVAMRVIRVEKMPIDKASYMRRSIDHIEDFLGHATRELRIAQPGLDVAGLMPQH
jgi:hypothetical protein